LCNRQGFSPEEAFRFGLFERDFSGSELAKYISRKRLTKIQEAVNPVSWAPLLKNKGIFYRHCMALGIPVPRLYAIFFRKTAGWSYNGSALRDRDDWKRFFETQLPEEFVIKPVYGCGGKGLNIFRKTESGFVDVFGRAYKSEQLYEIMSSDVEYDSFIIQQRLMNHPELIYLSGTDSLQTVRFITFVDSSSQCHILLTYLKPIINEGIIADNFQIGRTGNAEARISLEDGTLSPALQITGDGSGVTTIHIHPRTGVPFNGFKLPLWHQTCELVKETAPKFLPIRAIGWDVAITKDGTSIVEGNIWWDPCNEHLCMDKVVETIAQI